MEEVIIAGNVRKDRRNKHNILHSQAISTTGILQGRDLWKNSM